MKRNLGISCCYGIVFIVYSVALFTFRASSTPGFWGGYGCSLLMLALCLLVVWKDCFGSMIAHLQFTLGAAITTCFLAQLVLGIVTAFLPFPWAAVAEVGLLGVGGLCTLCILLGEKWIANRTRELQDRQRFIRTLSDELAWLVNQVPDLESRKRVEALQEAARFSDPLSVPELEPLEQRITEQTLHLSQRVAVGDWDGVCALCATLTQLLKERNRKCKALK